MDIKVGKYTVTLPDKCGKKPAVTPCHKPKPQPAKQDTAKVVLKSFDGIANVAGTK